MKLLRLGLAVFPLWGIFFFSPPAWGQKKSEWYISNAGGMTIEKAASRFAAMRSPYCLLVEEGSFRNMPDLLRPYYRVPWFVELRVLYKDGEETRRQWLFREGPLNRLSAVFTRGQAAAGGAVPEGNVTPEKNAVEGDAEEKTLEAEAAENGPEGEDEGENEEKKPPLGFIEVFGEHGLIVMERQFLEDGELFIDYVYRDTGNRNVLIRADTRRKALDGEEPAAVEDLYTDYYRYTRNYSLRLIERIFAKPVEAGTAGEEAVSAALSRFPRRSFDSESETGFVSPVPVYGSRFLEDIGTGELHRIVYTTDERGRILAETREDEEGNIVGELRNTWSGDRLSKITWEDGGEERITEYTYNNDGDRIEERNYRNGVMERLVRIQGDREDEELYMNGELILRTRWEGGRKVHEEQVRPGGQRSRRRGSQ